jgi:hypothetical protein
MAKPLNRYVVTAQVDAVNEFAALQHLADLATTSESLLAAAGDGTISVRKSRVQPAPEEPAS